MSQLIVYGGLNHVIIRHNHRHIGTAVELYVSTHTYSHTQKHIYNIYNKLYMQHQGHLDLVLTNQEPLIIVFIHVLANE